jgi:parallel beta-helix repeat protein
MANAPIDKAKLTFAALALIAIGAFFSLFIPQQPQLFTGSGEIMIACNSTTLYLNESGSYYMLTADCLVNSTTFFPQPAIRINNNSITLDCRGYKVQGNPTNAYDSGIIVENFNNTIIKNCNVSGHSYGVVVAGTAGSYLQNNSILNCTSVGYWIPKPCVEYTDLTECNSAQGCSGIGTLGYCTGGSSAPVCWGAPTEEECRRTEGCEWDTTEGACPYCKVPKDGCLAYIDDERGCAEHTECAWGKWECERHIGMCYAKGILVCDYTNPEECVASGCTWVPSIFSCTGDSSCSATQRCAAYYNVYVNNSIMDKANSPSGAMGIWDYGTKNSIRNNSILNNTRYGTLVSGATNLSYDNDSINSPNMAAYFSGGCYDVTINNSRITAKDYGSFYALIMNSVYRSLVINSNLSSHGYPLWIFGQNNTFSDLILNSTGTYAIASNGNLRNTYKNILAQSSGSYSIVMANEQWCELSNITLINTAYAYTGILLNGAKDCNLSDIRMQLNNGTALALYSNSNRNTIENINSTDSGISIAVSVQSSSNNTFRNMNVSASGNQVFYLYSSSWNNVTNCNLKGKYSLGGTQLYSNSNDNTFRNNTIDGNGGLVILGIDGFSTRNLFIGNQIMNGTRGAVLSSLGNNTFCLNNFSNISGYYIYDTNGSNIFTCKILHVGDDGIPPDQGNAYENVLNGSVVVTGTVASDLPPLYIGSAGAGVPYNNSTSGGKFYCNFAGCADTAPLTPFGIVGNLTVNYSFGRRAQFGVMPWNGTQCWAATNQTDAIGVYNMTTSGGLLPVYAMLNASILPCYNLTLSTDNVCAHGTKINETNQLIGNVTNQGYIWAWMDYAGNDCTTLIPHYNLTIDQT